VLVSPSVSMTQYYHTTQTDMAHKDAKQTQYIHTFFMPHYFLPSKNRRINANQNQNVCQC